MAALGRTSRGGAGAGGDLGSEAAGVGAGWVVHARALLTGMPRGQSRVSGAAGSGDSSLIRRLTGLSEDSIEAGESCGAEPGVAESSSEAGDVLHGLSGRTTRRLPS